MDFETMPTKDTRHYVEFTRPRTKQNGFNCSLRLTFSERRVFRRQLETTTMDKRWVLIRSARSSRTKRQARPPECLVAPAWHHRHLSRTRNSKLHEQSHMLWTFVSSEELTEDAACEFLGTTPEGRPRARSHKSDPKS